MLTQAQEEVDRVLGDRQQPSMSDYQELRYTMRCAVTSNVVPSCPACASQPRRLASARQEDAVSHRCVNESMRLYPHPPVLLRRSLVPDELPGAVEAEHPASGDHTSPG
jgi:carotenoid epsilon hydroxylase